MHIQTKYLIRPVGQVEAEVQTVALEYITFFCFQSLHLLIVIEIEGDPAEMSSSNLAH